MPAADLNPNASHESAYQPDSYKIPIRHLNGTAAGMNFWDAVYYLAAANGRVIHSGECIIETSVGELTELTGLTRQSVAKLRATAGGSGEVTEGAGFVFPETGRQGFELFLHGYAKLTKGIVWKPAGYVGNGWLKVLDTGPRMAHIPRRVLNIFFQKPRQRVYRVTRQELRARARKPKRKHPPEMVEIDRALALLIQLELLEMVEGGYAVLWRTFGQPAATPRAPALPPDPLTHPAVIAALEKAPEQAQLALDLLRLGRYDLELHFAPIFRDLRFLRPADTPLLRRKTSRHRHKPAEPGKWAYTWKRFQADLKKRTETVQSETLWLDMEPTGQAEGTLAFAPDLDPAALLWARLVA